MTATRSDDGVPRPSAPYLVVAGPTAVGKSGIAMTVAERLGGEIVIADSRQVYRDIDIGTAKPTPEERRRVPHHLVDVVDLGEPYTAADYAADARRAIVEIQSRDRTAVVCGGTGLYLRALAGGLDPIAPDVSDADRVEAAERIAEIPPERRHDRLAEVDPDSAERIHPNDRQRTERALEVWWTTGRPLSAHWEGGESEPLTHLPIRLSRPRAELHRRIEERLDGMLEAGLEAEARGLWEAGRTPDQPGLDTIGYQEWWSYFDGAIDRDEVRHRILVASRRYAKRQETWFRRQDDYLRIDAAAGVDAVLAAWAEASAA